MPGITMLPDPPQPELQVLGWSQWIERHRSIGPTAKHRVVVFMRYRTLPLSL